MRIGLILLAFILSHNAVAIDLKMYIGSAENVNGDMTNMKLQLIVCNNTADTIFIQRSELDRVFPRITIDLADITQDAAGFFYLANFTNMITDNASLLKLVGAPGERPPAKNADTELRQFMEKNSEHPQREMNKSIWYIFAPHKCITINCVVQATELEYLKLDKSSMAERDAAVAYLTLPVRYFSSGDPVRYKELLISRSSDELKKCIFEGLKKKK